MDDNLRNKITEMSVDELLNIIENKVDYENEVVEFARMQLRNEKSHDDESVFRCGNTDESPQAKSDNKHTNGTIIAIICCVIVVVISIAAVVGVTYSNNKKIALDNVTQRINDLVDDIYEVTDTFDSKYDVAKDKLAEIKQLIDENEIKGLPVTKYNDASTYITDLKTFDDIYATPFTNTPEDLIKANELAEKLTNEKIMRKFSQTDTVFSFADCVKKLLLSKSFYTTQKYVLAKNPGCEFFDSAYYDSNATLDNYTYDMNNRDVGMQGVDFVLKDEKEAFDLGYITTVLSNEVMDKIKNKGGYAIVAVYRTAENGDDVRANNGIWKYSRSSKIWWTVGFDVTASYTNGEIRYDITKYVDGTPSKTTGLTLNEAMNYVPITISE